MSNLSTIPRAALRHCRTPLAIPTARAASILLAARLQQQQQRRLVSSTTTGAAAGGGSDYQLGPANTVQPQPGTQVVGALAESGSGSSGGSSGGRGSGSGEDGHADTRRRKSGGHDWKGTSWKMLEAAATTGMSLGVLGLAGYGYHRYYKSIVLQKIDNAFNLGDPALNLATACADKEDEQPWIILPQQKKITRIIGGDARGRYYLLIGEKGTGKTSMLLSAMHKIEGDACSMMEAHADPEIFRLRLGKALDFEFHEDYIGSLFSIRGPRDTTALLDIERALNKLEKVALNRRTAEGRKAKPLVMIINSMHLLRNDENGRDLLELLQQKAESWAASGLVTMIFNSDDYWVYERLKQYGSRMELISVKDLPRSQAIAALKSYRVKYRKEDPPKQEILDQVYDLVGGRLSFLNKVARERDMIAKCREICEDEKTWLLNNCGLLGMDMDDDVMNQQKEASSAMVLVKYLVDMEKEEAKKAEEAGHDHGVHGHRLPELPLYKARQVMTRAEFIELFDHKNIFTIDCDSRVRADSVPMMNAFREVVNEEGFAEYLEDTLQRISDIESLGRTREITIKDLWHGGKYNMTVKNHKGQTEKTISWDVTPGDRDAEKADD